MRIVVATVGRGRAGPAQALYEEYARRLVWPLRLHEVEARRELDGDRLRAAEAKLLLAAVPAGGRVVALDERGESVGSADFARRLAAWRDGGAGTVAFVIGGADGLDPALRERADWVLSLGAMTWPHLLVRALLAEQLYRAQQILAGHPYHRA